MFWHVAWFEVRYWLRSWILWIFLFSVCLAILLASSTDHLIFGAGISNTYRNAPVVVESRYVLMSLLGLLMCTPFVNFAALREFTHNSHQIIFSTPTRRRDFLLGRFFGATVISAIPMLGVFVGILLAKYMPWLEPERWGAVNWTAHLDGIFIFALPNIFFMASILFAVAVLARNEASSFIAALILFMGFVASNLLFRDIQFERAAALLDPFAFRTLTLHTKYWTVAEKNTLPAGLGGVLLLNRVLWLGVSCVLFVASYYRFSFAERGAKHTASAPEDQPAQAQVLTAPLNLQMVNSSRSAVAKLLGSVKIHFLGMARSNFMGVITVLILLDVPLLMTDATEGYGNHSLPVTYWIISLIREDVALFVLIVIAYYAGVLVWKDRDERMDQIVDATPTPEWISYAARLATLLAMVMIIQVAALLSGLAVQAWNGYHRFQLGLYIQELLIRDASGFTFLAILAFLIHALASNKYVGFFVFIIFYCANAFLWRPLNVATNLIRFAGRPNIVYSDFFGDAPYRLAWDWFTFYWLLFCALLAIATVMFWPRGKDAQWTARGRNAALRFRPGWKLATAICLLAFSVCGGWIWYNTKVLNILQGPEDVSRVQAEYEKTYKPLDKAAEPRARSVRYAIDIFPEDRRVDIRGDEVIYNPYSHSLDEIQFSLDPRYDTSIDIPGAVLAKDDARLSYRLYRFTSPLQPGEERTLRFSVRSKNRGFENSVSNPQVVENGTFVSNLGPLVGGANYLAPVIGYNYWRELTDSLERKKYGLQEIDLMPALERNCTDHCRDTYLPGRSDWVDISAVISTSPDQIAIAPGSLVREWQQDNRRYFEYKLDHPSMNLYFFASARYEVAREEWNGIKLEVYYLKEQPWNVPRMMNSMKKSLGYYIKNFGPYDHKEARIVEFPRVAGFAAAFPGTMPYSESLGFIANLGHPDDIDNVFYVVAHEMGHQWWDGQVIGANMEGATLLSETLAQYSALMVMEKEYGRDMMRKFLKYEMDRYLSGRGQERLKERPLLTVEYKQFYIFYNKGSVVLYYLKELIGENAVNQALRNLIRDYGYAPPPYPTSYALLDALREQTPAHLQHVLKDLFEDITLFSNRTLEATAVERADGQYNITVKTEARKFKADATGKEVEVPVDDWIDIGAFAKPLRGNAYGATLYRERLHVTQRYSSFTFTTPQLPEKAGIDPFALLIDRIPDDNVQDVTLESAPARPMRVQ
jgi:ABC-type transport system involved in multi-copper enzyme maturation permease subunit